MRWFVAMMALMVLLGACTPDFEDPRIVQNLRILGVRAEPPEAAAGQDVTLDALVVTPESGADVSYRWTACAARDNAGGSAEDAREEQVDLLFCDGNADAVDLGSEPTAVVQVPPDYVDDPVDAIDATLGGRFYFVQLVVTSGGEERSAIKRIVVSPPAGSAGGTEPNTNPTLLGVDVAQGLNSLGELLITPEWDDSERQTYVEIALETGDGACEGDEVPLLGCVIVVQSTETFFFHWYSTEGGFLHESSDNQFPEGRHTPPASGGTYPLWVVMRDGRGGIDWLEGELSITLAGQ